MILEKTISDVEFAAIDFESAGSAPGKTDAPIQIGITTWSLSSGILKHWTSYIFTDEDITWSAQKVHGITKSDLSSAPKLPLLWPTIKSLLADRILVAHGHGTEKRFLRAFPGHPFNTWVDTLTLSRRAWPSMESHKLESVCKNLQIAEKAHQTIKDKSWHDALFDATASIFILESLIETHDLASKPLSVLI